MAVAEPAINAPGWLRDRSFDLKFIVGIAALALLSGWVVVREPSLFPMILLADVWLLGYHHVVSTYTRLCFDLESFRTYRFLILWLPLLVLGGVLALGFGIGLWSLVTLYLYWQWFHYTRQSWGISQAYRRKSGGAVNDPEWLSKAVFYALPIYGILFRSHQAPETFLNLQLRVVPVPAVLVDLAGLIAGLAIAWWLVTRALAWWQGRLAPAHTLFQMSHFTIFYVAYVVIDDITYGWLVVNIWHNAQYIAFVWLFNTKRYKTGIDPKARFLSFISQEKNSWFYMGICIGLSTALYLTLQNTVVLFVPAIIIYQTLNFHHYIVDGVIWKMRRKPLQRTLGIAS